MRSRRLVGYLGEMTPSKRRFDQEMDRLLAGDPNPDVGEDIAELVTLIQSEARAERPATHLASTLARQASESESVPARARSRTARPLPARWKRRMVLTTFLSSLIGKLMIGTVALATTTGGLAATGNLPDPMQDWASERLGAVGIEVPDSRAADTAGDVVDVIEDGDPQDGDEFGGDVSDTASDGKSSDGLDTADDRADNAVTPDQADDRAGVSPDDAGTRTDEPGQPSEQPTPDEADQAGAGNTGGSGTQPDQADSGSGARP